MKDRELDTRTPRPPVGEGQTSQARRAIEAGRGLAKKPQGAKERKF
jgi:hypothetical protein